MTETRANTETFGTMPDGRAVFLYILQNKNGARAKVTNYGAILTELLIPNKNGDLVNVVLGYDTLAGYLRGKAYFGATIGRVANRIDSGKFTLEGTDYQVACNDDRQNALHGGPNGFDKKIWAAATSKCGDSATVSFTHRSEHMEEGFPGAMDVQVTYKLTDTNTLIIDYLATTDATTIVNLTNHSYFNLDGAGAGDILDHEVRIAAEYYTAADDRWIPTGELAPVAGTPLDFRRLKKIGAQINELPAHFRGYDHNFVLQNQSGAPECQIELLSRASGRRLRITTTQPGVQLYCGNFLDSTDVGHGGTVYHQYYGLCLETQHFPDAVNKKNFPSVVLKKGDRYEHRTVFDFNP